MRNLRQEIEILIDKCQKYDLSEFSGTMDFSCTIKSFLMDDLEFDGDTAYMLVDRLLDRVGCMDLNDGYARHEVVVNLVNLIERYLDD